MIVVMDFERQWFDLLGLGIVPSNNTLVRTPRYRSGGAQARVRATKTPPAFFGKLSSRNPA